MHFSFIGKAQFRRATLFCDSSYLVLRSLHFGGKKKARLYAYRAFCLFVLHVLGHNKLIARFSSDLFLKGGGGEGVKYYF